MNGTNAVLVSTKGCNKKIRNIMLGVGVGLIFIGWTLFLYIMNELSSFSNRGIWSRAARLSDITAEGWFLIFLMIAAFLVGICCVFIGDKYTKSYINLYPDRIEGTGMLNSETLFGKVFSIQLKMEEVQSITYQRRFSDVGFLIIVSANGLVYSVSCNDSMYANIQSYLQNK